VTKLRCYQRKSYWAARVYPDMPCCVAFEVILINIVVVHELLKSMIYLYFRGLRRGHGEEKKQKHNSWHGEPVRTRHC